MTRPAPLPPALDAARREFRGRSGRLSYYAAGDGPPMLLLHGISVAASAYEVRPLFDHFSRTYRTYAPDLPGFGFSERSNRRYYPGLYCDAVRDVLNVIEKDCGRQPIDALALTLSCEFLARVGTEVPSRFRTLAFVNPTGFTRGSNLYRAAPGSNRERPLAHGALTVRLWREQLYRTLTSRRGLRRSLERAFGAKTVPESLVDYAWRSSRRPGASHAPFAYLSGRLNSRDIRNVYEDVALPVWIAHGTRGEFSDFTEAAWTRMRPAWRVQAYPTGAMVHFEQLGAFCEDWEAFLAHARPVLA